VPDVLEQLRESLGDRYQVERELGRGGMATVYLAQDIKHSRQVALKVLHPELAASFGAERFAREIGIAATLTHPHILPLYDSGAAGNLPFYVMPYIAGETLGDHMERVRPLPLDEALRLIREVADALACAHANGIVHRDIKPDNILLSGGHALVADFGIARAVDAAGSGLTSAGIALGTPHYMSPEQAAGDHEVDGRADIYALGCVAYEMLAGHPPFHGSTAREVLARHARDPVPPLASARPDIPRSVQQAVERALAKVPVDRFATAAEFAAALDQPSAVPSGPHPATRAALQKARRLPRLLGAAAVLGLAAVAVAALRSRLAARPVTDPNVIAVLPFRVVGDSGFQFLREGMVDLLATKLGAMDGPRPVDSRTVLATWRRSVSGDEDPSTSEARAVAAAMGSGRFVLGDVVATPRGLSISARLLDSDGIGLAEAAVQGPPDSLFSLVDQLSLQLLARSAGEPGRRLADLTSTSLPAVRAYLAGRAAIRRGQIALANQHFTQALEIDSTFALAALGMAASGAWSQQAGQSQALRRGLRTGYSLRGRLPQRDQLLFEAYVLPGDAETHSAHRQLVGWQRAAEAAPESPEAQYEFGDRLYHAGEQLGITDAPQRAATFFARALALDSTFVTPVGHLVELAARSGDRRQTRRLLGLYTSDTASADAGDYVRWRAAVALGDDNALVRMRGQRIALGPAALNRIIGFGQVDGVALADVDSAAAELRRRIASGTISSATVHPGQALHSWALNRGRLSVAEEAVARLRDAEPIPPGFSIVYFGVDQVPVLDALFWDGDSGAATAAVARLEARVSGAVPRESGARAHYFTDLCVVLLWNQWRARPAGGDDRRLERLRSGTGPSDSAAVHGGSPALCVAMLDAAGAVRNRQAQAPALLAHLDSALAEGPYQFGIDFGNLVLARLHDEHGDRAAALRAIRRRPYDWDTGPLYLSTFLREEGRLAALAGDREGAARAWRRYLDLRSGADSLLRSSTDSVRAALDRLP